MYVRRDFGFTLDPREPTHRDNTGGVRSASRDPPAFGTVTLVDTKVLALNEELHFSTETLATDLR